MFLHYARPSRVLPLVVVIGALAVLAVRSDATTRRPVAQPIRAVYLGVRHSAKAARVKVGPLLSRYQSAQAHRDHTRRLRRLRAAAALRRSMRPAFVSWYGPGLYGNKLGCGGRLTPGTYGVANKTLGCGTPIVVCLRRCIQTRVVDRGPYVGGREFDLTAATAQAIGFGGVGYVRVRVG